MLVMIHIITCDVISFTYWYISLCHTFVGYCTEEDLSSPMPEPGPVQESQKEEDKKEEEEEEDETDEGIEEEEENAEKKEEL